MRVQTTKEKHAKVNGPVFLANGLDVTGPWLLQKDSVSFSPSSFQKRKQRCMLHIGLDRCMHGSH
jgi:hypothetical protein